MKAKEARKLQPLPSTAATIQTKFKRVIRDHDQDTKAIKTLKRKEKKNIKVAKSGSGDWVFSDGAVYNADGTVQLGRDSEVKYNLIKKKLNVSRQKMRALKKQLENVPGAKKKKKMLRKMKRNR